MKEYNEDDFLMLSGIQHYLFCKRQWALIHIEQQWSENYLTIDGNFMHKKVHDKLSFEKRNDVLTSRGIAVRSYLLGISGECDAVEFHLSKDGIPLMNREGLYDVIPIEYKRGKSKNDDSDILQLAAQAMCLEEMFCCTVNVGYLFYGETRHRMKVDITDELRDKVIKTFDEMHVLFSKGHTPNVKSDKNCYNCSLKDICIPKMGKSVSVNQYIDNMLGDD